MRTRSIAAVLRRVAPDPFAATRTPPNVEDSQQALAQVTTIGTQRKLAALSQQRQAQLAALRSPIVVGSFAQQVTS
jgi:hypothetical protein